MLNRLMRIIPLVLLLTLAAILPTTGAHAQAEEEGGEPDFVQQIESQFGVVEEPLIVNRIQTIRDRLLTVIPEAETDKREIVVRILDDENINAFALPDGHVYLFRGIVEECETDDMVAGVMAHEFTHVFHNHHSSMGERQLRGMVIGLLAVVTTGEVEAALLGEMLAASMVETYGRSAEEDADRTGVIWSVQAGYDPLAFLELMQILEQDAIHSPEPGGNYFTIHPHPDDRMADIKATLEELGVDVPDTIYRVHLRLAFYLPLSDTETARLTEWENLASEQGEAEPGSQSGTEVDDSTGDDGIPPTLLKEYRLRRDLFAGVLPPREGVYGVVAVDNQGVFYIAESTKPALTMRGEQIVTKLGALFLDGLRSYEVQARTIGGEPALVARRKKIALVTELDAELAGITTAGVNRRRVEVLKDILWRYYVSRRI